MAGVTRLVIRNLPFTVGNAELKQIFSRFGNIVNAKVMFNIKTGLPRKFGFVTYTDARDAEKALNQQTIFIDGNYVEIDSLNR